MELELKLYTEENKEQIVDMITELFNYHRKILNSREEFYQTREQSINTLEYWNNSGEVLIIQTNGKAVGFFFIKYGGQKCAWLEDLFIHEKFRGRGIGKKSISLLDDKLESQGVMSIFVDVVPRNIRAIELYQECGFDHLNMIQLRKNYDETLNKEENINLLGYTFKKY